jgi:hypothetical protein
MCKTDANAMHIAIVQERVYANKKLVENPSKNFLDFTANVFRDIWKKRI